MKSPIKPLPKEREDLLVSTATKALYNVEEQVALKEEVRKLKGISIPTFQFDPQYWKHWSAAQNTVQQEKQARLQDDYIPEDDGK